MDESLANPESLTTLSATVNKTLVETGKFFRSTGSVQSRNQMKRALPTTHEQFQSALDNLSEQIFIAKAFLEQDYEVAKAKRKAREPPPKPVPQEQPKASEDIPMPDMSALPNQEFPKQAEEPLPNSQPPIQASESLPQPTNDEKPNIQSPVKAPQNDNAEQTISANEDTTGEFSTEPPPPGDSVGMDLDSMFPPGPGEGPTNLDMAMEFPSDEAGDQNFLAGNNLFGSGDNQNKNQDSMSSLLPGLENYANAPGNLNINTQMGDDSAQISPTQRDSANNIPPGESNFDDLFMDAGGFGGGGGGEDLLNDDALVEIGDLDDSWLD